MGGAGSERVGVGWFCFRLLLRGAGTDGMEVACEGIGIEVARDSEGM
jgi:hypothetical protein